MSTKNVPNPVTTFGIVTHEQRPKVLEFIETWGRRWHDCAPPPTQGGILAAWQNDKVVGTISVDRGSDSLPLPLERLYDREEIRARFPAFDYKTVVQGGRWFAAVPNISRKLIEVAAHVLVTNGVLFMLAEGKSHTFARLKELDVRILPLPDVPFDLTYVPPEGRKYYREPPPPQLFLIDLEYLVKGESEIDTISLSTQFRERGSGAVAF